MSKQFLTCAYLVMFVACATMEKLPSESQFEPVTREELEHALGASVEQAFASDTTYMPRWFYSGTKAGFHYFYYYHPTYVYWNEAPRDRISFYKLAEEALFIPREINFTSDPKMAEEVFRRPSAFSELPMDKQHKLRKESGATPETPVYDYNIEFLPYSRSIEKGEAIVVEEYFAFGNLKRKYKINSVPNE